jgi:hypothetical protein
MVIMCLYYTRSVGYYVYVYVCLYWYITFLKPLPSSVSSQQFHVSLGGGAVTLCIPGDGGYREIVSVPSRLLCTWDRFSMNVMMEIDTCWSAELSCVLITSDHAPVRESI